MTKLGYLIAGAALAIALAAAVRISLAASSDAGVAEIVNSGSTNTVGFKISVRSGGQSTVVMQNRAGIAQSAIRAFTLSTKQSESLFADLKTAKAAPATQTGCMKSASFGSSTHVQWQGWTSSDLECPSNDAAIAALKNDITTIRTAAGIGPLPQLAHPTVQSPLHAGSPPPSR